MKVFVSSTYIDLVEYRKAVERAINLLEQQFVGMEYFGALSEEPKVAALRKVEGCDVFVGIYARRYGFVPDGDTKSITEQEFDRAQKFGKTIFCYRVKPDQPWNPKMIEGGDAQTKLDTFLERIDKQYVRQEFTTPDDLLAKVSADLARHLSSSGVQATMAHPLPPGPYYVHSYPLQANFTGRKTERGMLSDWFTREPQSVFVLDAIGGMGKSALAWVWAQDIFSLGAPAAGVFWWSFYEDRDLSSFLDKALSYASHGAQNGKSFASDRERIDALLAQLRDKRFLFVLDGFERVLRAYARMDAAYRGDEFDADAQNEFRACTDPNADILVRSLAMNAGLTKTLITTRLMPRELDELESVHHVELTGLNPDDAVKFFERQGIKGTRAEIESACADYAFHPLSLRLLSGTLASDPRYKHDIKFAPRVNPLGQDKERKMLDFAYNSLPPRQQKFISQLAAFRGPLAWDTMAAMFLPLPKKENAVAQVFARAVFKNEDELAREVTDLIHRGLLQRDTMTETYDLHPVVHRYCYNRLKDKPITHAQIQKYLLSVELRTTEESQSALIEGVIDRYFHTARAGQFEAAFHLFYDVLSKLLYHTSSFQLMIELLHELVSEEDGTSRVIISNLKNVRWQGWILSELANSYAALGNARRAIELQKFDIERIQKTESTKGEDLSALIVLVGNVAVNQILLGELEKAEWNLNQRVDMCRQLGLVYKEMIGHLELARVLMYRGEFEQSKKELETSNDYWHKSDEARLLSFGLSYYALFGLLTDNPFMAIMYASEAIKLAEEHSQKNISDKRDFVEACWLIGAGHVTLTHDISFSEEEKFKMLNRFANIEPTKLTVETEQYLQIALKTDRERGFIEYEAPILLEFAKLRIAQARQMTADGAQQTAGLMGHVDTVGSLMDDSLDYANEALRIADRCEYRLQQAEIHSFLAEWHWKRSQLVKGDAFLPLREDLKQKAREHAEKAKERAWCDGPPYYYKVAWEKAEKILETINSTYSTDSS